VFPGHKDIQTTMRYSHLSPEVEPNYIARLEGISMSGGHVLVTPAVF